MGTGKGGGDNVVVAVRVRPFNDREKSRKAQLVIEMPDGQRTCIRDPDNSSDEKWFTFDHSYWSHDGFQEESNGLVPTVCEELFKNIEEKKDQGGQYEVFISMFEIYCEKIRDLLSSKEPPKGGLKIREHPKTGFYVENLSSSPVNSYKEIEAKIDEGTKNRTIAATNMNATSSREDYLGIYYLSVNYTRIASYAQMYNFNKSISS
ncbi:kinesin motor domain protein [Necator americanus]|uniref:Kinesin motor domain protein n=1 Tax=Necator americanus TaxID=51031 RepID=W2SYT4_NECAM|nr:kinesin motor domain protein [Necator americanus]ETN74825.1 kinesin motor domain protein [Necator americanus]